MGFFNRLKEWLTEEQSEVTKIKTRDGVYSDLCATGLNARMAERGIREEHIGKRWGKSEGLIEIQDSAIRWVDVLKREYYSEYNPTVHYLTVYIVPDSRMHDMGQSKEKSFLVQGKLWDDILSWMNQSKLPKQIQITLRKYLTVHISPDYGCWVILSPHYDYGWNYYEIIARNLLEYSDKQWPLDRISPLESHTVCPRCRSSNINKSIKRLPKSQSEIEALGFKSEWDCLCVDCRYEWVEREK